MDETCRSRRGEGYEVHADEVPMLAFIAAPSERTIFASTTLRIAGAASQVTVQSIYSEVAAQVSAEAPRTVSSGDFNRVQLPDRSKLQNRAQ